MIFASILENSVFYANMASPPLVGDGKPLPKPFGKEPPEEDEQGVAPVDDGSALAAVDGPHDQAGGISGRETHGIAQSVVEQGGLYEARADVGEGDGAPLDAAQLSQGVEVGVLKTFRRGVGRSHAQALGACDGAYGGDVAASVA